MQTLPNAVPCALAVTDATGRVMSANEKFARWTGRALDDIIGKVAIDTVFRGGAQIYFKTYLWPQLQFSGEIEAAALSLPGDPPIDVLLSATLNRTDGSASFALILARTRLRHERTLSASVQAATVRSAWLDQLEDLSDTGAWSYSVADQALGWSDKVFTIHGLPPGDPPRVEEALKFYRGDATREEIARLLTRAIDDGEPFSFEAKLNMADGSIRKVRSYGEPVWDHGNVVRVNGIFQDITVQRRMERERDQATAQLASIAGNLPGALLGLSRDAAGALSVTFASTGCEAIWGVTEEMLRADVTLLAGDTRAGGLLEALDHALRDGGAVSGRFPITLPDGSKKWLELRGSVTRQGPQDAHADCIVLDITPEVSAQAEANRQAEIARKAQKLESLGQLTGGVAHDFNNLLAVILGNLELLQDRTTDADAAELIAPAIQAAERGAGLTRSLLAFARQAKLDPIRCDLNQLVRETLGWAARTIPSNIDISTDLANETWPVRVDVDTTSSALLNLLLNARDAMLTGGSLLLRTRNTLIRRDHLREDDGDMVPGRYVCLDIIDTGTGIPPDVVARIFEPFFTTKSPGKGTGLGLAMVQGFMKQSGGTVRVESEVGIGTTISLLFPALTVKRRAVSEPTTVPTTARGAGQRILMAEDEPGVRVVIQAMLEREGYQVDTAPSGDAALKLFRPGHYAVLLTDTVMPGRLLGPALAKELRRQQPDLPVVIMSGYAAEATGDRHPGDAWLTKPVRRAALLTAISSAIAAGSQDTGGTPAQSVSPPVP